MKVLIAEDEIVSRSILEDLLNESGYEVISCANGSQAWQVLQQDDAPQLVILDWMMPDMDGPEICQRVRAQQKEAYTYIILLTSMSRSEDIIQGLEAGADDYMTKPFDPGELKVRLLAARRVLKLESDLMITLAQLKESEALRKQFVSALTHDLRTPLIAEGRSLEILSKSLAQTEQNTEKSTAPKLIKGLQKNNQELLSMVNMLLDNYQYEDGHLQLYKEPFSVHVLAKESLENLAVLAQAKHIQLLNNTPEKLSSLLCDGQHVKRVITNLVSNALANCPEGTAISISAWEDGDTLKLQVQDNGPGISPELVPHLFEKYYLAQKARKIGSGLGLSICKTIMNMHGGSILAKSQLGQGTAFVMTFPRFKPEGYPDVLSPHYDSAVRSVC